VWHEDDGFRKTIILNTVIKETDADYLIFTDGDCIPDKNFVATHRERGEKGYFLSGGYYKLDMAPSKAITREDITSEKAFSFKWLAGLGQKSSFKRTKLSKNTLLKKVLERVTPTKASWNGMNSSAFKSDIESVNGFDERMQYGGLDRELGERLINKGIRSKQIRYSAICLHLDHARGYSNPETWERNRKIRADVKRNKSAWTPYGIVKQENPELQHAVDENHEAKD
jgi:GT2 family glycosyltransferase